MPSLTIRNIDEDLKKNLRMVAAANNRSMEEEARQILRQHLSRQRSASGIGSRIAARFAAIGGTELPEPERSEPREPPAIGVDEAS